MTKINKKQEKKSSKISMNCFACGKNKISHSVLSKFLKDVHSFFFLFFANVLRVRTYSGMLCCMNKSMSLIRNEQVSHFNFLFEIAWQNLQKALTLVILDYSNTDLKL